MASERLSILMTGATGNLGQKLRRHLTAARGYDLRLACLNPSNDPAVTTIDLSVTGDNWAQLFDGVDVVLHFAVDSSATADRTSVQRNNIDVTRNVFRAAIRHGVRRVVFASSNWTMAGYRFGTERLTTELPPRPAGFYGTSKAVGERMGKDFARDNELSVICLRIGYRPPADDRHAMINRGRWEQEMWISERDFCQLVERATLAKDIPFAIVNGVSNNPDMRWDLEAGRRLLAYEPEDGRAAVMTNRMRARDLIARLSYEVERLRSSSDIKLFSSVR